MKVLLVDDEPFELTLLSYQLRGLGFEQLLTHERAREALSALEGGLEEIGLIFCDLQMPDMDGVELVRHLDRIGYAGGLVLVSGEDERVLQTVQRLAIAHRLHVLGAVRKPASPEALKRLLAGTLARPTAAARTPSQACRPEALSRAIAGGELVNHYQPKVGLASGKLIGVETLVRWSHPQDGLVFPDQFIPVAEQHGLIDELTRTVLRGALRQARLWLDAGLVLHVAVNVSMDNLTALEFPEVVVQAAREAGVPLTMQVLEVTESQLMKDPLASLDILARLRLKHVGLSIDDFGTGHSSLAQLRDVPFDELKVDRGFVHGACRDASQRAIVEGSLRMARQLGMTTVAEGVEDREDWDFLRQAGCDQAQGYFIARPMPAADLLDWKAQWEIRRAELCAN